MFNKLNKKIWLSILVVAIMFVGGLSVFNLNEGKNSKDEEKAVHKEDDNDVVKGESGTRIKKVNFKKIYGTRIITKTFESGNTKLNVNLRCTMKEGSTKYIDKILDMQVTTENTKSEQNTYFSGQILAIKIDGSRIQLVTTGNVMSAKDPNYIMYPKEWTL